MSEIVENKRDKRVTIRFTVQEFNSLIEQQQKTKHTLAGFIRAVSLRKKVDSKVNIDTVIQLKRIGGNINQIAKVCNSTRQINDTYDRISKRLEELKCQLDLLLIELKD